ncbi:MAG: UDP-2,4-diacetamido-2,4,6-trideoxy-beta-L-altropyranose hydrolase [Nitrosomonadaceae bacterium]|nr:UDP-2,4-diacetamido-2,4,6-trideoxy-beta-L-altropyranose hydrolase [Nitrosomonadaceae bacterium]
MRIAIRVDASSQIGTGHFMRCLTLADELKQRGALIRFVSRQLPKHLRDMLTEKEHEFTPLNSNPSEAIADDLVHAHWLGISQHADAQASIQVLSDHTWDWLVVDHYALDARWESALRQMVKNILVIDDIADRQHDCDVLLDQNLYADMGTRYTGKVPSHCQLLLGPRYALLREEFRQLHEQAKPRTGPVKRMLVFFGGVDANNYTGRIVEALANLGIRGLHVDVVIGSQHPSREQIESECVQHGFTYHVQTDRMAELMAAADLAIGAGGSAIWERCCLGLPTLTICTADNQNKQIVDAASEGLLYAPELKDELVLVVNRHVSAFMENSCLRRFISSNGIQAVDGRGVLRVTGNLGCSGIEIRTARQDDLQKLFEWRNHPTVRTVSRNPEVINWENHQKWFAAVLMSPDSLLLIGQREGAPVGVVRFDIQDDEAEVSIYLVPGIKESGLGQDLLQSAEHWFAVNRPRICKVRAHVLGGNERSQRLFLGMGYQVESTCYSKRLH